MAFTSQNMAEYGDFNISENEPELYLLLDNDILASLDLPFMAPVSVEETKEVEAALEISDMEGLPRPGVPAPPKRFKSMTEEQIQMFEDSRQSNSTKRNTKWGVKLFQGICLAHLKIISGNLTCLKLNVKKQQHKFIYRN